MHHVSTVNGRRVSRDWKIRFN